jgi:hypothetical protein
MKRHVAFEIAFEKEGLYSPSDEFFLASDVVARDAQTERELKNLKAAVANAITYRDSVVARDAKIREKLKFIIQYVDPFEKGIIARANEALLLLEGKV